MAREVRFIEPVASISGDLGKKQRLYYGDHNNAAWDSPRNELNPAKNYRTTYVGLMRRRSGKNYFAVRRNSTFNASQPMIMNCALMGAANVIAAFLIKDLASYARIQTLYRAYLNAGGQYGMRAYVVSKIKPLIEQGAYSIAISEGGLTYAFGANPYTVNTDALLIPSNKLVKFWEPLVFPNGYFYVNGEKGIYLGEGKALYYTLNNRLNVLGLDTSEVSGTQYVTLNGLFLIRSNGAYLVATDDILPGDSYTLTSKNPQ